MELDFLPSIDQASSWCEVSQAAIWSNVRLLRQRIGSDVILGVVVKSDGFGHGMVNCAREFIAAGADWLVVNFAYEAARLRQVGITAPIYICGNVSVAQAELIVQTRSRLVLYDADVARAIAKAGREAGYDVPVHLKIETGTHRQGLRIDAALALAKLVSELDGIVLEGIATHYADIEDTTDHRFAMEQLAQLQIAQQQFQQAGFAVPMIHSANSAATILWNQTHGSMVRVGLAAYGLWPSRETYVKVLQTFARSAQPSSSGLDNYSDNHLEQDSDNHSDNYSGSHSDNHSGNHLDNHSGNYSDNDSNDRSTHHSGAGFVPNLQPVLSWRARVVQVKDVPVGGYVSYGRTFRATYPMKIAILPLGYHEGYDRRLSNLGYVLIHGMRSPIRGRICMNMFMVDVTHIPDVKVGTIATLLGRDGEEQITAEQLASWMGTINYEVVARIHPSQPRFLITDHSLSGPVHAEDLAIVPPLPNLSP